MAYEPAYPLLVKYRTYNILAFTTFCLTVYTYFQWKRARREATGVNETDAEYYTRILNIENARVMRFSLSGKKLMDEYISPDQIREKYNLPPPTNPTYRPPVKTLAPTPATEQLSS